MIPAGLAGDDEGASPAPPPHLVLVGLPGAGKSSVGRLLAEGLGCEFVDLDLEIECRAGLSVSEIFSSMGEAAFRRLELEATVALRGRPPMVIAPGGGWMAQEGTLEAAGTHVRTIFLQVSVEAALARLGAAVTSRPLLWEGGVAASLARLSRDREPFYMLTQRPLPQRQQP